MPLFLVLLLLAVPPARLELGRDGDAGRLRASYTDRTGVQQQLEVELPEAALASARTLRFDRRERLEELARRLRAFVAANRLRVEVKVEDRVRLRGDRRALPRAKAELARLEREVLAERGLEQRCRPDGADESCRTIGFALGEAALRDARHVAPIAEALGVMLEPRERVERTLSFVQAIPYAAGEAGTLRTPLAVLRDGRGDCDEKVALFVALLRAEEPRLPLAVVHIEDHAFVAIGIEAGADERVLKAEGRSWLVAEPVGPGRRELGRIAPRSEEAVEEGKYVVRVVPEG